MNQFGARYRAAKSYKKAEFASLATGTAEGYSALFRILLTYSAFESFLNITGKTLDQALQWLSTTDAASIELTIRKHDAGDKFFGFIVDQTKHATQKHVDQYLNRLPYNILRLAVGVRHVFAHGILSPNAGGARPEDVSQITNTLCDMLSNLMDREFELRMDDFEKWMA